MSTLNSKSHSTGVALFLSLILLLVMTLIGVTIMSSSNLQERMAGSQKRVTDSSFAAESAIAAHLEWLLGAGVSGISTRWGSQNWPNQNLTAIGGDAFFQSLAWTSSDGISDCAFPDHNICRLRVEGVTRAGNATLSRTFLDSEFEFSLSESPLGGSADILCGGNFHANVMRLRNVRAHCDSPTSVVSNSGRGSSWLENSTITSNGTENVNINSVTNSTVSGDAGIDDMPVPPISQWIQDRFFEQAKPSNAITEGQYVTFGQYQYSPIDGFVLAGESAQSPIVNAVADRGPLGSSANCPASGTTCNFSDTTVIEQGGVLFCDGNVVFDGGGARPLGDLTVIATCDIEHNGALTASGSNGINFYAGRNMTFNGASSPYVGRFFLGGNVTFNGNSFEIMGQIIAEGDIQQNGQLTFIGAQERGGGADTMVEVDLRLLSWRQRWQ